MALETTLLNYLLHIAPSIVVLMILLKRQDDRLGRMEVILERMLQDCWQDMLSHHIHDESEKPKRS